MYLDATGRVLPFGTLGEPAMDKAALPTRGYKAMLHTPLVSAAQHAISTDVQVVIGEDGRGKGEADVSGTGSFAAALRNMLENAPPAFDTQYASAQLARAGLSGNGTVTRRVSPELDSQPGFSVKFETGNWLTVPGPGAFRLPTGLFAGTNVRSVSLGLLNSPPQKVDRRCMPTRFEEKLTLDLPEGLMPKVPANAAFSNRVARYEAHYVLAGRKLTVTRTLEMSFDHVACTPEEGGLLRDAAEALRRDVEAQVLY